MSVLTNPLSVSMIKLGSDASRTSGMVAPLTVSKNDLKYESHALILNDTRDDLSSIDSTVSAASSVLFFIN